MLCATQAEPVPGWFEFHEVFHLGTVIGYACHVVAIYLIACALVGSLAQAPRRTFIRYEIGP